MAYVNNGTERSLKVKVYKKVGGNYAQGYPKTYDGQEAFPGYSALTDTQFRQLSDTDFTTRYNDFVSYVESIEGGVDFDTDIVGDGATRENAACLATTTTTIAATTTTTAAETTTTTEAPVTVIPVFLAQPIGSFSLSDFDGLTINEAISAGITDSAHVFQKYTNVSVSEFQKHTAYGYTIYNDPACTIEYNGPEEYMAVIDTGSASSPFEWQVYINALGTTHFWISL